MGKIHDALEKSKKEQQEAKKDPYKSLKNIDQNKFRSFGEIDKGRDGLEFQPSSKNQRTRKHRPPDISEIPKGNLEFQPPPKSKVGLLPPNRDDGEKLKSGQ